MITRVRRVRDDKVVIWHISLFQVFIKISRLVDYGAGKDGSHAGSGGTFAVEGVVDRPGFLLLLGRGFEVGDERGEMLVREDGSLERIVEVGFEG